MVGVRGFEPPTSAFRTQRSTKLSHTPPLGGRKLGPGSPPVNMRVGTLVEMLPLGPLRGPFSRIEHGGRPHSAAISPKRTGVDGCCAWGPAASTGDFWGARRGIALFQATPRLGAALTPKPMIFCPMSCRGNMWETPPSRIASRGIPNTTQEASSWAIVRAP